MLKHTQTVDSTIEKIAAVDPIIRLREFLHMAGLGRATVYRMMALGLHALSAYPSGLLAGA
jgi:predicted DNA-binding transcriptional regulator AlpA